MIWDCAIIGAGAAGLMAATYLGRFRRSVVVIDAGESRLKRIPLTRNAPGFPEGIEGVRLYERMLEQASRYGATFQNGIVDEPDIARGRFRLRVNTEPIEARTALLATGATLVEPDLPNLDEAIGRGVIRYCPICDGFEASDKRIAVLGGRAGAIKEAHFLRTYSHDVTFLWLPGAAPSEQECLAAAAAQISLAPAPAKAFEAQSGVSVLLENGERSVFDVMYPCLGCEPRSELAGELGAKLTDEGGVEVDSHQRTDVGGLYAAGDVLQGLDQIASACGQAAIAATAIHNDLREGGVAAIAGQRR